MEQCSLLQGNCLEVTSRPFQLSASSCDLEKLRASVHKKDHAWKELPGGVAGALARVSTRPKTFVNVLNPIGTDSWTFSNTVSKVPECMGAMRQIDMRSQVLLPSVLTSDAVLAVLADMYHLAQHVGLFNCPPLITMLSLIIYPQFIHMTAGKDRLEVYTAHRTQCTDEAHPVAIITMLLRDRLGGRESNYPDKVCKSILKDEPRIS